MSQELVAAITNLSTDPADALRSVTTKLSDGLNTVVVKQG